MVSDLPGPPVTELASQRSPEQCPTCHELRIVMLLSKSFHAAPRSTPCLLTTGRSACSWERLSVYLITGGAGVIGPNLVHALRRSPPTPHRPMRCGSRPASTSSRASPPPPGFRPFGLRHFT